MSRTIDVTIVKGTGDKVHIPLFDAAGVAITDFTGWTAKAQVRSFRGVVIDDPLTVDVNESNLLHTWDTAIGTASAEFADKGLYLKWSVAETVAWSWRRGVFDVRVVKPGEAAARPVVGFVWVRPQTTD